MTSPTTTREPEVVHLEDYRPPSHLASTVDLVFELHEDHALVTSTTAYSRNAAGDGDELVLHGVELELVSISLDGRPLEGDEYRVDDRTLRLSPGSDTFTLQVVTRIEPQNNTTLEGLYRSRSMFCTQMEAEGFRRVTYYQDRPDVLAVYTTTIVADKHRYPTLLSNGNLVDSGDGEGGRHFATWHDPFPKPSYLFALVAGDLARIDDEFHTVSGRDVALRLYVDKGNESKAAHAMASLKRSMRWDEEVFGREYDLDVFMIVAVADFNMGAMENKGLNLFNDKCVLADPASTTDQDFQRIEGVVGHEYFHNWSGNRVTCRDWFQLSLKEGFTVFRDQEFSSDMGSRAVQRIADVQALRARQFPEDAGPLAHPVRPRSYMTIDNFYTTTIYEKGAEVIRMMHALLGAERFRRGSDLYFERHDGQAVTTDDFVNAMEEVSGLDLTQFRRWYEQSGTPRLRVSGAWDGTAGTYDLTLEQRCPPTPGQPEKKPFHIPVRVGLLDDDGEDVTLRLDGDDGGAPPVTERVLELTDARQTFRFVGLTGEPTPSVLRGFSAPVRVEMDLPDERLAFLAARDGDLFNRWEACQTLSQRAVLRGVADTASPLPDVLFTTFAALLEDETLEEAFVAEALTLPQESALGDLMEVVDVDGIHASRERVREAVATRLADLLRATRERLHVAGDGSTDQRAMGRRALANVCLGYLAKLPDGSGLELAREQQVHAGNMTDELAALELLADVDGPHRDAALADFKAKWRHDPLVMNHWFAAQAASSRPATAADVARLADDPDFDRTNPNKLRSLYRTFAENVVRFHAADGSGYALLGELVLDLDRRNPILAGRLAAPFNSWRRYDEGRRALMRGWLERMVSLDGASPNLYEVASRALSDPS